MEVAVRKSMIAKTWHDLLRTRAFEVASKYTQ